MKNVIIATIASVLSFSAAAVDFSTTVGNTTTSSMTDVNQHITGTVVETNFEYSQNRGAAGQNANGNACTPGLCDGNGNDTLSVGVDITATIKTTQLDQLTTGLNTTVAEACDVTVSIGGASNSQGVRSTVVDNQTQTVNNNLTTIKSGSISVSTQTDVGYTAGGSSKPGNDFNILIGGQNVGSEGNMVNPQALVTALVTDASAFTITGQDLNAADTNALSVTWTMQDLNVVDTSVTDTTTQGTMVTVYENN